MFSKEANDIMNGLHMYFGIGDESTSSQSELEISANFDFTIKLFGIFFKYFCNISMAFSYFSSLESSSEFYMTYSYVYYSYSVLMMALSISGSLMNSSKPFFNYSRASLKFPILIS